MVIGDVVGDDMGDFGELVMVVVGQVVVRGSGVVLVD